MRKEKETKSWLSLNLEKLTLRQQSPGKNILIWGSRRNRWGLFGAGSGTWPGQFRGRGESSWTGDAEAGAPRGRRMWPVGLGVLEEQVWSIQAVTQKEVVRGICFRLAFSLAEVNYSTLCLPAPGGEHATQFENRHINKPTISASASRLLSEIHCFPPPAASWQ